jgi:hypothetical protein
VDDEIRDLERQVIGGDESLRRRLEACYERTGSGEALVERLRDHMGRGRRCEHCRGTGRRAAIVYRSSTSSHVEDDCSRCDGLGLQEPLRFAKPCFSVDYATLVPKQDPKGRGPSDALLEVHSINNDRWRPFERNNDGVRGWIAIARLSKLTIASAAPDDWTGHQLLSKFVSTVRSLSRGPGRLGVRPGDDDRLLRFPGATIESGPLIAWWSGATSWYSSLPSLPRVDLPDQPTAISTTRQPQESNDQ